MLVARASEPQRGSKAGRGPTEGGFINPKVQGVFIIGCSQTNKVGFPLSIWMTLTPTRAMNKKQNVSSQISMDTIGDQNTWSYAWETSLRQKLRVMPTVGFALCFECASKS